MHSPNFYWQEQQVAIAVLKMENLSETISKYIVAPSWPQVFVFIAQAPSTSTAWPGRYNRHANISILQVHRKDA